MTEPSEQNSKLSMDADLAPAPTPLPWLEALKRQLQWQDEIPREADECSEQFRIQFRPHVQTFEDVRAAAEGLRANIPQIVSLTDAPAEMRQRLLDFLQGVIYTIRGSQVCISSTVFLFTPSTVPINVAEECSVATIDYRTQGERLV